MRVVPKRWNNELWVCSLRGHVTPALDVQHLRPVDAELGVDRSDGTRLARCLRCDVWIRTSTPPHDGPEFLADHADLPRPRRGKALENAILLRLIAIERAIHCIAFTLLAIGLVFVESNFSHLQQVGNALAKRLNIAVSDTGQQASRSFMSRSVHSVLNIHQGEVRVLLATAVIYAIAEGVEAVGLWHERRWAEYLTAVATVGFLPFEIFELLKKVTTFRVGTLLLNIAVLAWLIWAKRLFGFRGGTAALEAEARQQSLATLAAIET